MEFILYKDFSHIFKEHIYKYKVCIIHIMDFNKFSLGSKKNIKKEINVDVNYKHIIGFFIFLLILVSMIMILLSKFNIGVEDRQLQCSNGSLETITHNKEFYCGVHYSTLKGSISESSYNHIEEVIKNGE